MTRERLYLLARETLLARWYREHEFLIMHPDNEAAKASELQYWQELNELETECKRCGYKI